MNVELVALCMDVIAVVGVNAANAVVDDAAVAVNTLWIMVEMGA